MTEPEWLASESHLRLFRQVQARLSARKLKLLACGCCRVLDPLLSNAQRNGLGAVERHADGLTSRDEYQQVVEGFTRTVNEMVHSPPGPPTDITPSDEGGPAPSPLLTIPATVAQAILAVVMTPPDLGLRETMRWVTATARRQGPEVGPGGVTPTEREMKRRMCTVFREVVGNPFRVRDVATPEWVAAGGRVAGWMLKVGETARAIARGVEADQAFDRLPILADALEDDGCSDQEVLAHLRGNSHHLRGCWAVDLVLGKS